MAFRIRREIHGPYIVHLCEGNAGDELPRPMIEARKRRDHTNAFAVVSGWLDRVGPDGVHRFSAGQMDDELPDYPCGGAYKFVAGENGVVFWCIGRFPPGCPFIKTCIRGAGEYVIEAGALGALVAGSIEGRGAPLLIKPRDDNRIVTLDHGGKMLVLKVQRKEDN